MINGFLIEITNENNEEQLIHLFKDTLPGEVSIKSINSNYDYPTLSLMALNQAFEGSGIVTDIGGTCSITIHTNGISTTHQFSKSLDNQEIIIDGKTNYLSIFTPPKSKSIVQLVPVLR